MTGLECLNRYYEELSVIIAKWSYGRKGLVCDCLPSCTEVDLTVVHDNRDKYVIKTHEDLWDSFIIFFDFLVIY